MRSPASTWLRFVSLAYPSRAARYAGEPLPVALLCETPLEPEDDLPSNMFEIVSQPVSNAAADTSANDAVMKRDAIARSSRNSFLSGQRAAGRAWSRDLAVSNPCRGVLQRSVATVRRYFAAEL